MHAGWLRNHDLDSSGDAEILMGDVASGSPFSNVTSMECVCGLDHLTVRRLAKCGIDNKELVGQIVTVTWRVTPGCRDAKKSFQRCHEGRATMFIY